MQYLYLAFTIIISRRFGSAAIPYDVLSTIGHLSDSYALVCSRHRNCHVPALRRKYSSELVLFLGADVRVSQDEVIVAVVVDVLVQRHYVDVLYADVHADTGLAVPEEVDQLFAVGRVVGRLQLTSQVKVFKEHVRR